MTTLLLAGCGLQPAVPQSAAVPGAQLPAPASQSAAVPAAVVQSAEQSVLPVACDSAATTEEGTAWAVYNTTADQQAVTAAHVVAACPSTSGETVQLDDATGTVTHDDPMHDLATLYVTPAYPAPLTPENLAPRVGDQLALIGYPGGAGISVMQDHLSQAST